MITTKANANRVGECEAVMHACDKALTEQKKLTESTQKELDYVLSQKVSIENELTAARKEKNAWYRDPLTLFLTGVIVGVVGVSR